MAFLDFVKPSMQAYSTFCNHKSAIVCSLPHTLRLRAR